MQQSRHVGFFSLLITLVVCTILAMLWVFIASAPEKEKNEVLTKEITTETPAILPDDPIFGPDNAKVTVIAFMDFGCTSCAAGFERMLQVYNRVPEGTMRIVWKDLPEHGEVVTEYNTAHQAARCAAPYGAFWAYAATLFNRGPNGIVAADFTKLATDLSVPEAGFNTCLDSGITEVALDRTIQQARARGISSTPYFYINDRVIKGVIAVNELQQIILEEAR